MLLMEKISTLLIKLVKRKPHFIFRDKYQIEAKGNQKILSIDFNPNKQYYLMAAFHDSLKFYDVRKGNLPVKCHDEHHSLILNAKYNHSHD